MTGWGSGYVTDVAYMPGYYRQQAPQIITLACQLSGVAAPMPGPDDPVSYLELGCGQGFGAMILAASNPKWRVTAIDFNPAHIVTARAWAAEAALDNVTFIEADLATLAEESAAAQVPEADFVSMHGLWSWVPQPVKDGIVRLLRAKVRPGGAVHLSYNSMPGWGAAFGMQRIMREGSRPFASRSDRRAEEGLKLVRGLLQAGAVQLKNSPWVSAMIGHLDTLPSQYLAHEYINDFWAPCFHADVATELADAKLEWVGSASLLENFPELMLTEDQRALVNKFNDPLLRELVKDVCLERSLRNDVFIRGAIRLNARARDAALMGTLLSLNVRPEDVPTETQVPAGLASMSKSYYGPIAEALVSGPRSVGDLLSQPTPTGRRDNPSELIGILVGLGLAEPALRTHAEPSPHAWRFNRITAANLMSNQNLGRQFAAASTMLGMGAPCSLFDLYVLERVLAGAGEGQIEDWVKDLGGELDAEGQGRLREALGHCLRVKAPILRAAGVG